MTLLFRQLYVSLLSSYRNKKIYPFLLEAPIKTDLPVSFVGEVHLRPISRFF